MGRFLSSLRMPLLLLTVLVLQHTTLGSASIDSVHPDLLLLFVCSVAVVGGREAGAVAGFVSGILADSFLVTPFGMSSLVYSFVGYLLGESERLGAKRSRWLDMLLVGVGSAAAQILVSVGLFVMNLSDPLRAHFLIEFLIVGGVNFLLSPVMIALVRFAMAGSGRLATPIPRR
ncbi:rod shape-determining protein MreD [Ferrithrix thermotolerans DSM 19514]|jgi:rod shape-determining protein MreD|uniref:Rod shape-determining protein MreD n=1 Tax=Ferrithrix thermotolerans DSM 19514 TaxID=1121881 RepID=A0A1M4W5A7_9ACTN|nr:rod shape-determining protein MreD [Ferrithrix thermotolerans]SHE76389.1 rod shape-determining protein MreD [Ferrithrix thermotolerans DSM 19514]